MTSISRCCQMLLGGQPVVLQTGKAAPVDAERDTCGTSNAELLPALLIQHSRCVKRSCPSSLKSKGQGLWVYWFCLYILILRVFKSLWRQPDWLKNAAIVFYGSERGDKMQAPTDSLCLYCVGSDLYCELFTILFNIHVFLLFCAVRRQDYIPPYMHTYIHIWSWLQPSDTQGCMLIVNIGWAMGCSQQWWHRVDSH